MPAIRRAETCSNPPSKSTSINLARIHLEQRLRCEQGNLNADKSRLIQAINSRVEQVRSAWTSQEQDGAKFDALLSSLIKQELKDKVEDIFNTRVASFLDAPFQLSIGRSRQRTRKHSTNGGAKEAIQNPSMHASTEGNGVIDNGEAALAGNK